jgi:hypothetical protein
VGTRVLALTYNRSIPAFAVVKAAVSIRFTSPLAGEVGPARAAGPAGWGLGC